MRKVELPRLIKNLLFKQISCSHFLERVVGALEAVVELRSDMLKPGSVGVWLVGFGSLPVPGSLSTRAATSDFTLKDNV